MTKIKQTMMLLVASLAMVGLSSCNDDNGNESNYPHYYTYTTLATDLTNNTFWFVNDNGKTMYPSDLQYFSYENTTGVASTKTFPLVDKDGKDKNGIRMIAYFDILDEAKAGYDYSIALHRVTEVLTKGVETAKTAEELNGFGNTGMYLKYMTLKGEWLDTQWTVWTGTGAKHVVTLVDNQCEQEQGVNVPDDYIYLEVHLNTTGAQTMEGYAAGSVSFKLPDSYNPKKQGKKGLYIRYKDMNAGYQYLKVDDILDTKKDGINR